MLDEKAVIEKAKAFQEAFLAARVLDLEWEMANAAVQKIGAAQRLAREKMKLARESLFEELMPKKG